MRLRPVHLGVHNPELNSAHAREQARHADRVAGGFRRPCFFNPMFVDGARLAAVVEAWSRDPRRNPRTLIRAVVDQLDRLRPVTRAS
jgi:hypothetical protein